MPSKKLVFQFFIQSRNINVWAGISFQSPTRLVTFIDNLDRILYKSRLIDYILPDCRALNNRNFRIVQDNDSKYTQKYSKICMNFVMLRSQKIGLLIHQISTLWRICRTFLKTNLNHLGLNLLLLNSQKILYCICVNYIKSMRNCMNLIIQSNGDRIPY